MNDMTEIDPLDYDGFPEVQGNLDESAQQSKPSRKGFQNELYSNDSLTCCGGFINEIKKVSKSGETLYFARAGIIVGSKQNDQQKWVGDIVNCDLLVGSTLKNWAEYCELVQDPFKGIRMKFQIRNLKFTPGIHDGKPVLNSRGILETVSFGHID